MYLNIDLKNVKKEEVREVLKNIGVAFEEFNTPLEMFLKEEADFRLQNLLDGCAEGNEFLSKEEIELLNSKEEREAVVEEIANEYFNKEIFDYDYMDDIRDNAVREYINNVYQNVK